MSATILIDCPKCARKIGIPGDSGTIHVTCPGCREQWDWPRRRTPAKGATRQAARVLLASFTGRIRGWFRAAFSSGRFSALHLAVALLAGVGLGIILGTQTRIFGGPAPAPAPQAEATSIPADAGMGEPGAPTNILNPPGIDPKIDESFPTNVQETEPAASKP
jgi:hypothetical protein